MNLKYYNNYIKYKTKYNNLKIKLLGGSEISKTNAEQILSEEIEDLEKKVIIAEAKAVETKKKLADYKIKLELEEKEIVDRREAKEEGFRKYRAERAEREKAEREKTEREKAEREKAEREKAEREKAERERVEEETKPSNKGVDKAQFDIAMRHAISTARDAKKIRERVERERVEKETKHTIQPSNQGVDKT